MTVVFYSFAADAPGHYERRWLRSIRSLRARDDATPVVVCLFGDGPPAMLREAERLRVEVLPMGEYDDLVAELPPAYAAAIKRHRCLHKLASLRRVQQHAPGETAIYLDCDTYLLGDVAELAARSAEVDWLAREEPATSRCRRGHHPGWVDEPLLEVLAAREGLVPVPPYNTGVFAVSAALARALAELTDEFLWYCWRLLVGAAHGRPSAFVDDPAWQDAVRAAAGDYPRGLWLDYPAQNIWVVDQVGLWMLLGRVPGTTHAPYDVAEVAQSDEYLIPGLDPVAVHYFSAHESAFERFLAQGR